MAKRCRFVTPEVERLPLSDGDWIEVKKRINVGEHRDSLQESAGAVNQDGWFRPNVKMVGVAQIIAYLVDWNLSGPDGKVVKLDSDAAKLNALRGLHLEDFAEIDGAIEAHILKVAAEDADAKKSRDGKPGSEPTSPSVAP